jgi:hypothetical protein
LQEIHDSLKVYLNLTSLLDFVKNFFLIVGGVIALASYKSQHRQRAIDNSFNSLKMFEKTVQSRDVEIWKNICFNTYESTGAVSNHFVVFSGKNEVSQIPLSNLFISEGQGLLIPDSKFNLCDEAFDLELGSIRRITEQLNFIGYEVLYGNTEIRIIYYELGQIIESVYQWIDQIQDQDVKRSTYFMFPYFLKMCKKYRRRMRKLPKKIYVGFD